MLDNIKTLIPVGAVLIALAGFYYSTQHRLDHLEAQIEELVEQDKKIKKMIRKEK